MSILPIFTPFIVVPRGPVIAGNTSFTSAGTFNFLVPEYNTLTVDLRAGGGGGGAYEWSGFAYTPSSNGGNSAFLGMFASGGVRGTGIQLINTTFQSGSNGGNGGASGGSSNIAGGGGGGGTGWGPDESGNRGGNGGAGGRCVLSYAYGAAGAPIPGQTLSVTIGGGGAGGSTPSQGAVGGNGGPGAGFFSWA